MPADRRSATSRALRLALSVAMWPMLAAFTALSPLPARAQQATQPLTPAEVAAWRADLHTLVTELPRRHPDAFHTVPRARFDSAAAALDARIPAMRRHEVIVGLEALVALIGDGHTTINPFFDPVIAFREYPIRLWRFSDGLFVTGTDAAHRDLLGARVVRFGALSADSALARVATVIPHENAFFARVQGPAFLGLAEVAGALGIVPDLERATLEVEQRGRARTVTLAPGGPIEVHGHGPRPTPPGFVELGQGPDSAAPLWRRHRELPYWAEWVAGERLLYVCYRGVVDDAREPNSAFWARVFAMADSLPVERFVLDLRENGGGNSFYNRQVVLGLVRRARLDRRGHLFAIIGGRTYSAAYNLASDLERWTNVTFAGEPTGEPAQFFGDHRSLALPNSGVTVNISSLWWQPGGPTDRRPWIAPRITAEPSSADYASGSDPVMQAILARAGRPELAERLTSLLAAGDSAGARREAAAFAADSANRYVNTEAEVNALGYHLLGAGDVARAVTALRINAGLFPRSANAHDSLGEALERAGERAPAAAEYRRALELNPELGSSREGLARTQQADTSR